MVYDWQQERDEYEAGRLCDAMKRDEYERQRNEDLGLDDGDRISQDEMIETFARERIEVDRYEMEEIAERAILEELRRERGE